MTPDEGVGPGIVLIGYRGAGKSTIGPRLAARLDRPFVDLDTEIERDAGRSIAEIFAAEGEPAFRDREAATLAATVESRPGCVLATGGGVVLREANRARLRRHGLVVWLRADAVTHGRRLRAVPGGRPSLTGRGLAEEVADVLAAREPIYAALAALSVDTGAASPDEACKAIAAAWAATGRAPS